LFFLFESLSTIKECAAPSPYKNKAWNHNFLSPRSNQQDL